MEPLCVEYVYDFTRPYETKSQGVRSEERNGQATDPHILIQMLGGLKLK